MIQKIINFDDVTKEDTKEHNLSFPKIPYHPYRIQIIGGPGSGKTNSLFNLTIHQPDVSKIHLYAKHPHEPKCHILIKKRESTGLKHLNNVKAFIEYSNYMGDIYKNIAEYNSNKNVKY